MYARYVDVNEERIEDRARKFIQRIQQIHQKFKEQLEKNHVSRRMKWERKRA
jgi:hypothetical protein